MYLRTTRRSRIVDHSTALEMLRAQAHASSNLASSAMPLEKFRVDIDNKLMNTCLIRMSLIRP